ncbi:MAG: bifunctional adenosylcobinamide kinase/adenosylcobinamide-phosphate guanylyltransferase [Nannocystaceae bacterium]
MRANNQIAAKASRRTRPGHLVLIGGSVRSGKSNFALSRALQTPGRRAFFATAEAHDTEMRSRIQAHVAERGDSFETIEEPLELAHRLKTHANFEVVVIDCLTLWLSNRLLRDQQAVQVSDAISELVTVLTESRQTVIVVTNEVGMGVVPPSALGRQFRDLAGEAHRRLAAISDEVYLATMGMILRLRPHPVVTL